MSTLYQQMIQDFANQRNCAACLKAKKLLETPTALTNEEFMDVAHVYKRTEGMLTQEPVMKNEQGWQMWRLSDGTLHRNDGPAVIDPDGYCEHWVHGTKTVGRYKVW